MTELAEMDEATVGLAFQALDQAVASVSSGDALIPFTIFDDRNGQRSIVRYAHETFEAGLAEARDAIARDAEGLERVALAFDGYLTRDGERVDAVLVHVFERGADTGHALGQRYRPMKPPLQSFEVIGNPSDLGPVEPLFPSYI
jgi:hypothetical protein